MTILVRKNPYPLTRAQVIEDHGQELPEGFERMTQGEFNLWLAEQPPLELPPEPLPEKQVSKREIFKLLGVETWRAIEAACADNLTVDQIVFEFYFAEFINVNDPDFMAGMDYLCLVGLISDEQKAKLEALRKD
jgi:hypothetical protein